MVKDSLCSGIELEGNEEARKVDSGSSISAAEGGASGGGEPAVRVVDKILSKRVSDDAEQYYVSWKGLGDEHNSWKLRGELECLKLVNEFEEQRRRDLTGAEPPVGGRNVEIYGFSRGLKPVRIKAIGQNSSQQTIFRVLWNDGSEESVPGDLVKEMCPQLVIKFYENKLFWNTPATRALGRPASSESRKKRGKKMKSA